MKSGIYKIANTMNDKIYIGSSKNVVSRLSAHRRNLEKGTHPNKHLQSSYDQYGLEAFTFIKIEDTIDLLEREQYWIDTLECCNPDKGYNLRVKAESNAGMTISESHKQALLKSITGRQCSEETRSRIGNSNRNRKLPPISEDTRKKLSEAGKGRTDSEETRKKKSESRIGITFSEEHKQKLSQARQGKVPWNKGLKLRKEE